jgi:hypothetical protein
MAEPESETTETETTTASKPGATGKRGKRAGSKAPAAASAGPVHVLLDFQSETFEVVLESELEDRAAEIRKNPRMKLIRGSYLVPQISFVSEVESQQ